MAIALDATSSSANQVGSSVTFAHTCSGSNRILIVGISIAAGIPTVSSVTYNGVALTQIASVLGVAADRRTELWYLIAPATGSNNIVVTLSGAPGAFFNVGAVSYTGAKQSGQPDVSANTSNTTAVTTTSQSVTTTTNNCWTVGVICDGAADQSTTQAGTTFRLKVHNRVGTAGYELFMVDSNGAVGAAGSYSLGETHASNRSAIIVAGIAAATTTLALTDDLVAYYKLDESSGNASDSSGNAFTLTNTNTVAFSAGKITNAADTGSSNTNKKLDTSSYLRLGAGSPFTFNLWVNVTTTPSASTEAHMLSWCDNTTAYGKIYNHLKFYNNAGTLEYYITRNNGGTQTQTGAASSISTGTWNMLTYTWDGANQKLYKNGNSSPVLTQASTIAGTNTSNGGTDGFKVFAQQDNTAYLSGLIDEVGVWSRVLSTSEISSLYNTGTGLQYPFTVASTVTMGTLRLLLGVGT